MRTVLCYRSAHNGIQWLASLAYDPLIDLCAVVRTLWTLLDFHLSLFSPSFVWDLILAQHLYWCLHTTLTNSRELVPLFPRLNWFFSGPVPEGPVSLKTTYWIMSYPSKSPSVKSKVESIEWSVWMGVQSKRTQQPPPKHLLNRFNSKSPANGVGEKGVGVRFPPDPVGGASGGL